jgi:hypothetical protein
MKKTYTLCDHDCPLKSKCARYCEQMDKTKTDHFATMPYKNGKCNFLEPLTEDDIAERVQDFINRLNN